MVRFGIHLSRGENRPGGTMAKNKLNIGERMDDTDKAIDAMLDKFSELEKRLTLPEVASAHLVDEGGRHEWQVRIASYCCADINRLPVDRTFKFSPDSISERENAKLNANHAADVINDLHNIPGLRTLSALVWRLEQTERKLIKVIKI